MGTLSSFPDEATVVITAPHHDLATAAERRALGLRSSKMRLFWCRIPSECQSTKKRFLFLQRSRKNRVSYQCHTNCDE
jgi:hypothetical protein